MSILTAEYNLETHMRVYGEELLENRNIEFAKKMLKRKRPVDEIVEDTGLTLEEIKNLQSGL